MKYAVIVMRVPGGAEEIYMRSTDLAPRNADRQVEVLFPLLNPRIVPRLRDGGTGGVPGG